MKISVKISEITKVPKIFKSTGDRRKYSICLTFDFVTAFFEIFHVKKLSKIYKKRV